jgi:hypothetical protein
METIHPDGNPLADYLEGHGAFESDSSDSDPKRHDADADVDEYHKTRGQQSFAPPPWQPRLRKRDKKRSTPVDMKDADSPTHPLTRFHHAWSSAVNSRLGRADNERFLEHFRYTIVASQLLEQYLDHGSLNPTDVSASPTLGGGKGGNGSSLGLGLDGASERSGITPKVPSSVYGAAAVTVVALVFAYLLDRFRTQRPNVLS